jgi:hypothetical protein
LAREVFFYPAVPDTVSLNDLACRAAWYLAPWADRIAAIRLWSGVNIPPLDPVRAGLDPDIVGYFESIRPLIVREAVGEPAAILETASRNAALLLIWRWPEGDLERLRVEAAADAIRARGGVVYDVDKKSAMNEGSHWLWGCLRAFGSEEEVVPECRSRLAAFAAQPMRSRAYVFGTGPSLADAANLDLSDGDCIISNSIVANPALLEKLRPIAVTACDPIFHAGCSQYAAAFRAHLRRALETTDMYFFTVMRDYRHYLMALPEALHARVIALPFREDAPYNFDLVRDFHLYPAGNVLTLGLLPLAGTFYDRISTIGCDGRPLEQNGYFWTHHKESQINDKMENIQLVHPGFFDRSYDDHYEDHCKSVARVIDAMERAGKRVDSATPSYIPALRARQSITRRAVSDVVLVSINPDARDLYGHWIGYDDRLAEQCACLGVPFVSLANQGLQSEILNTRPYYRMAFRFDTWEVEASEEINLERIARFEEILAREVSRLLSVHSGKRLLLYMYTGSLPHALAIFRVIERFPDVLACVNTFWTCVIDCEKGGYLASWGPFLWAIAGHPRFQVFAITPQLKTLIEREAKVALPLLPHPSPTGEEGGTANWLAALTEQPGEAFSGSVLFPGGTTAGKGFRTTVAASIALAARRPDINIRVRVAIRDGSDPGAATAAMDLERAGIEVLRHAMTQDDFLATIHEAGLIVLPYEPALWRYRNSGLAVDALYAGAPIVCFDNTWLGDCVARHDAGIAIVDFRPEALVEAVERVIADYPRYRANAIRAAHAYRAANSWTTLIDSVFATLNLSPGQDAADAGTSAADLAPIRWWDGQAGAARKPDLAPVRAMSQPAAGEFVSPREPAGLAVTAGRAMIGPMRTMAISGAGLLVALAAAAAATAIGQPVLLACGLFAVSGFGLACLIIAVRDRAIIHRALNSRSPELAYSFRHAGRFVKRHRAVSFAICGLAAMFSLCALATGVRSGVAPAWLNLVGTFSGLLAIIFFALFLGAMAASILLKLAQETARELARESAADMQSRMAALFSSLQDRFDALAATMEAQGRAAREREEVAARKIAELEDRLIEARLASSPDSNGRGDDRTDV